MENDDLGLEQPLKLGRVSRVATLTDELLFENDRGLPQVRNNYQKLSKAMRKNDKKCGDRIAKEKLSKSAAHQAKVACEVENLQKVLSFYQLWCHGLFPRATFKDCLKMLRNHKSFALKEYRRGLINNEIRRMKIEKGIILDEPEDPEDDLYGPANENAETNENEASNVETSNENADPSDDDWGFLSVKRTNGLFVDDEDEEPRNEPRARTAPAIQDDFDEDDFEFAQNQIETQNDEDRYDQELEIMREMGM